MKISSLLQPIQKIIVKKVNFQDQEIQGLALDYREITEKNLFFCIAEEEFTEVKIPAPLSNYQKAIKNGAVCILSSHKTKLEISKNTVWIQVKDEHLAMALITKKFFQDPFKKTKIIGITGTNGKTTTSQFINDIFNQLKKNTAVAGTLGIMHKKINQYTGLTTPLSLNLYETLTSEKKKKLDYLTIEITSHGNYYKRTVGIEFDIVIFTNLTQDHLNFHPSWEHYKESKLNYFTNLSTQKKIAQVLINIDDAHSKDFLQASRLAKQGIHTYSARDPNADFFAKILKLDGGKSSFKIFNKDQHLGQVNFKIPGLFNVYNALASFCACYLIGISATKTIASLEKVARVPGRFEMIPNDSGIHTFVDYAHTPDSLKNILQAITKTFKKPKTKRNLICVFGCGGNRDKRKRPLMGKIAIDFCDSIILTSDNPRDEAEMTIIKEIQQGIPKNFKNLYLEKNRKKAIFLALKLKKRRPSRITKVY